MHRIATALLLAGMLAGGTTHAQSLGSWDFVVRIDGEPIGTHRFRITADGEDRVVTSEAQFEVRLLGVPLYRYRHVSRERWRGDCLAAIDATTSDRGERTDVHGRQSDGRFLLDTGSAIPGCLMSFAYWNPQLPRQTQLLDPGTGRVVPVRIERLGAARLWRISGLPHPIEIEWDDRRWIALDTVISGRRLTYRLQ